MNKEQIDQYKDFAKTKLGLDFNDINLLITALTHRSYINEHKKSAKEHNERLEFLGDAILELASSDFLFRNYEEPEGIMTAWRSALVNTDANAAAGEELGYAPLIRLSHGEQNGSRRAHHSIIADCYEAIIGAIYLDQGYNKAKEVVEKHTLSKIDQIIEEESWRDAKSYLQELAQRRDNVTPVYKVLKEEGPDHDKIFTLGVFIDNKLIASGMGYSKQQAQTKAAAAAIRRYKTDAKKAKK